MNPSPPPWGEDIGGDGEGRGSLGEGGSAAAPASGETGGVSEAPACIVARANHGGCVSPLAWASPAAFLSSLSFAVFS